MGVFAEWQPRYAEHGIATFPTLEKKPAIKGWQKVTPKASHQFTFRFPMADELAFLAGPKSGLTVIDVDTKDEDAWRDAIKRFGETRIMVRTGSGNLQLWYRHNAEPRKIRMEGCIDILGGGQVLGFPSKRGIGYTPLRDGLEALHILPFARNIDKAPVLRVDLVRQGQRSKTMLDHLRSQFRFCDNVAQLIDVGRTFADQRFDRSGGHDYTDEEIHSQANSVWAWCCECEARGELFVGTGRRLILSFDKIDAVLPLGADAVSLFMHLQRWNNHKGEIIIANGMRERMEDGEWTLVRFRRARAKLIEAGVVTETRKASTWHGPATYTW
jgi:hypothetical protein